MQKQAIIYIGYLTDWALFYLQNIAVLQALNKKQRDNKV